MRLRKIVLTVLVVLFLSFSFILPASASQTVTDGGYNIEIGWLNEPPIAGQMNAIVMNLTSAADSKPVPNDGINLILNVSYGGQSQALPLQPRGENAPGQFLAPIVPTVAGVYGVDIEGSVASTDDIEANVKLNPVLPGGAVQFPPVNATGRTAFTWVEGAGLAALVISLGALAISLLALRKRG